MMAQARCPHGTGLPLGWCGPVNGPEPLPCRPVLLAHFASRGSGVVDIPAWALAYGVFAGAVVTVLWSRSRHVGRAGPAPVADRPDGLNPRIGRYADSLLVVAQSCSLVVFVALVAFAWFGPRSIAQNVAPLAVVGVIWSLGAWVALVAGPTWSPLAPFSLVASIGDRTRPDPQPFPVRWWSPVPVFASYLVVWVAWVDGDQPRNLAVWLTIYGIAMAVVAWRGGRRALAEWDAFGAALDLAGSIVHPGRVERMRRGPTDRRRVGVLAALVMGGVAANRTIESAWYAAHVADRSTIESALVSLALVALLATVFLAVWRAVDRLVERSRGESGSRPLGAVLAPIAAALLIAQGLTIGLVEAQNLVVLASDPLARGWNLFGTVYWEVSQQPLSPFVGGIVQVIVILVGHLAALGAIGRAATTRGADGTTSPRARNRNWTAALPAMGLVTVSGVVWTLLLLGR